MTTRNQDEIAAATSAVEKATAALDELLRIKKVLRDELSAARAVLFGAEKRLRALTKPDKAASRKHELETLNRRLTEAKENV